MPMIVKDGAIFEIREREVSMVEIDEKIARFQAKRNRISQSIASLQESDEQLLVEIEKLHALKKEIGQ